MNFENRNSFLLVMSLIICLLVISGCQKKSETALPTADDEQTVRQLANEFIAAYRLENPTSITRLDEILADDFCQRTTKNEIFHGKQSNLAYYRDALEKAPNFLRRRTIEFDIESIRMTRDLAVVFGTVKGEKWLKSNPKPDNSNFFEFLVFQKIKGKWQLIEEKSIVPKPPKSNDGVNPSATVEQREITQEQGK
jgi:hypothetical protein